MRRLLVALCVLLTLTLAGPVLASAQEGTPEAGADATAVTRTEIRYLLPFGPDGLQAGLTEAATVEGVCGFASIVRWIAPMPGTASAPRPRSSTPASSRR